MAVRIQKKSYQLLEQVQKVISEYGYPLTLRQIYYQLVARQVIPNEQRYYAKLSRLCVIGRDEGILDEDAFADRLRQIDKPLTWPNLHAFMQSVRRAYRKDKWRDQKDYLEIWTEKDALRNVLTEITYQYDVSLMVVRGQVSRTAIYEADRRYTEKWDAGKNCYLYYAGDFDPSGLAIYHSLVDRLGSFGEVGQYINYRRIALTPEQIETYNLPADPGKRSDPNYRRFVREYGDNVVELDSLPPEVLRTIVEDCIVQHIDLGAFEQVQKAEALEQRRLQELLMEA